MLGEAGSLTDYDTSVKKHLENSWYSMNFQHGVKFDLTIATNDNFAAATLTSLLSAGVALRKANGSEAEKQALKRNHGSLRTRAGLPCTLPPARRSSTTCCNRRSSSVMVR